MSCAVSQLSSGEQSPMAGGLSPAREKVRRLEAEAVRKTSVEATELREKCRTLDAEVASLRMDAAGNRRLLRKAQRDLDERAKRLEVLEVELDIKSAQVMDQRLLKTEVQRLQRLLSRATAERDTAARRRRGASEAVDEAEASPEDSFAAAAAAVAAETRAAAAEADAKDARNDLGNCLEELAGLQAEVAASKEEMKELLARVSVAEAAAGAAAVATAAAAAGAAAAEYPVAPSPSSILDGPASELVTAQAWELDRLKAEIARLQRLVEPSAAEPVALTAPAASAEPATPTEALARLEAALDAERREAAALRETNVAMHSDMLSETERLRGIAEAASAECAEQGAELEKLRTAAKVQGGGLKIENRGDVAVGQFDEAMQELERLEVTIAEERHKSADLLNRTLASEDGHARDVGMLEAMLQELMGENERLANQVSAWQHTSEFAKDPYSGAGDSPPSLPDLAHGGQQGCNSPIIEEPETEASPLYSSPVSCVRRPPSCPMLQQPLQKPPPFPTVSGSQIYAPQLRTQIYTP